MGCFWRCSVRLRRPYSVGLLLAIAAVFCWATRVGCRGLALRVVCFCSCAIGLLGCLSVPAAFRVLAECSQAGPSPQEMWSVAYNPLPRRSRSAHKLLQTALPTQEKGGCKGSRSEKPIAY